MKKIVFFIIVAYITPNALIRAMDLDAAESLVPKIRTKFEIHHQALEQHRIFLNAEPQERKEYLEKLCAYFEKHNQSLAQVYYASTLTTAAEQAHFFHLKLMHFADWSLKKPKPEEISLADRLHAYLNPPQQENSALEEQILQRAFDESLNKNTPDDLLMAFQQSTITGNTTNSALTFDLAQYETNGSSDFMEQ